MYNGQTKVQQTELDAFLAAAEELKIKGLTTNPTGNTNESTPSGGTTSRKRPSTHVQHSEDSFDNGNGQQKSSKVKKSRPAPNAVGQAGPSSASDTAGRNMVVKAEEVNLIDAEDDERFVLFRRTCVFCNIYVLYLPLSSYQDYAEAEIDEPFDESAYQDHDQDGAGADFPTDSKGM